MSESFRSKALDESGAQPQEVLPDKARMPGLPRRRISRLEFEGVPVPYARRNVWMEEVGHLQAAVLPEMYKEEAKLAFDMQGLSIKDQM